MKYFKKLKKSGVVAFLFFGFLSNVWGEDVAINNDTGTLGGTSSGANVFAQSFSATKTGVLKSIGLSAYGASGVSNDCTLKVYSDAGTGGSLLYSQYLGQIPDTVSSLSDYAFATFDISGVVSITSGSTYTIELSPATCADIAYFSSDYYAGGDLYVDGSVLSGHDMAFQIMLGDAAIVVDSDSTLTAGSGVDESVMIALPSVADTLAEKVDLFDFTITDTANGDSVTTDISQVVIHTSGAGPFEKVRWFLNGPDVSDVEGTYSSGANTITFSSLSISVANGANETYTLSGYFKNPTGLVNNAVFALSVNATDLTVDSTKSTMAASQSDVTNSDHAKVSITATKLMFLQQPSR